MKRLWPKSLIGQLMLVVALALAAAQLFNFVLLYRGGENLRYSEAIAPVVDRIADAADREPDFRPPPRRGRGGRGRFRLETENAVLAEGRVVVPHLERRLSDALAENGVSVREVVVGEADWAVDRPRRRFRERGPRGDTDRRDPPKLYRVSVRLEDGQWANGWMRLRGRSFAAIGITMVSTIVLYLVMLLTMFWFARRLSRPLRTLTHSVDSFDEAETEQMPVPVSGPTDIAHLIEAYNAMRVRIVAMLAEKDQMLGAIGHDLRTPLAALRIRAENVEDETERARMVETIEDMSHMLEDILSLARLGRGSGSNEKLDLSALADSAIEDFRDVGAPVEMEESPRVVVAGRPSLLKRAIANLVDNAIRYGDRATVRVRDDGESVFVEIDDEGPGIPEAALATVFEPFARLEASRNREKGGSGLGLALARAIVRDHGGELTLANRAGGGLRATIRLPRA